MEAMVPRQIKRLADRCKFTSEVKHHHRWQSFALTTSTGTSLSYKMSVVNQANTSIFGKKKLSFSLHLFTPTLE